MNGDQRAQEALPVAHALVAAVSRHDRTEVARVLADADMLALAVVLADMVANPSESVWLRGLLTDVRNPDNTLQTLAHRYGMTQPQLERIVRDNQIRRDESDRELTGGKWINVRGIQRWLPAQGAAA